MRAFLMCVGTRDPYWAKRDKEWIPYQKLGPEDEPYKLEGPILTFFKIFVPRPEPRDRIFLFSTQPGPKVRDPTEKGGEDTKAELEKRFPKTAIEHYRFPSNIEPAEFVDVYEALESLVANVQQSLEEESEMIVFVSPGTPQMQAAWFVLAHAGKIRAKLFRISFVDDNPQVSEVNLGPLIINDLVSLAIETFNRLDFAESAAIFDKLASKFSGAPQRIANFCKAIALFYNDWFNLDYKSASLDRLNGICEKYADLLRHNPSLNDCLAKAQRALQERKKDLLKARSLDLFCAACRKLKQGDWAESFWRFATVVEMIEVARARKAGYTGFLRSEAHQYLIDSNLEHALRSLEKEKWLFDTRNFSIHQARPITEDETKEAQRLAEEAIWRYFGIEVKDYPLTLSELSSLSNSLQELMA
jgi:hypothetical protein